MIRIISTVVIRLMAAHARRGQAVILPARVALVTRRRNMLSRQRELRVVMVEVRIPVRSRVARLALRREACGLMIRLRSPVVLRQVTVDTLRGSSLKNSVDMTLLAANLQMRACQLVLCIYAMIKSRIPGLGRMTTLAFVRKLNLLVVRRVRNLIVRRMARPARCVQSGILPGGMTVVTARFDMTPRERKVRGLVIELRVPIPGRMTLCAVPRELERRVTGRDRAGIVVTVTIVARRRRAHKWHAPVTLRAAAVGVPARERKRTDVREVVHLPISDPYAVTGLA